MAELTRRQDAAVTPRANIEKLSLSKDGAHVVAMVQLPFKEGGKVSEKGNITVAYGQESFYIDGKEYKLTVSLLEKKQGNKRSLTA
jgi:hypothetical protein